MDSTQWAPLADNILVRPLVAADRTTSGIFVAESHRDRPQQGVVLAVGPGAHVEGVGFIVPELRRGDLVSFGKHAGIDFELDGQDVLLMRDREALARKPSGTYALIEHEIPHGAGTRAVAHEAGQVCEHCERERVLNPPPSQAPGHAEGGAMPIPELVSGPDGVR